MPFFNSDTALIYMDIFYFNVNEEKNPESEEIWTPYVNINNKLRITVAQLIQFFQNIAVDWFFFLSII